MIIIDFDRMAEHATFASYRLHGADAFLDMCRLLTDKGWADQEAFFADERGIPCMKVRSIHSCARRYRPTPAEAQAKSERVKLRVAAKDVDQDAKRDGI